MLVSLAEHLKPVRALTKPHKGIVVDNEDPKKLGRVKVQISGLLPFEKDDLPWCNTLYDPSKFDVPEIGDELYIIFPYQSIYFPFALGYWHSESNTNIDLQDDYPNTFGISKQGFVIKYNKKEQNGKIEHPSGSEAEIDKDGNLTLTLSKDLVLGLMGKAEVQASGDITFTTDGALTFTAQSDVTVNTQGNFVFNSEGNATFSGKGGTTIGDSSSPTQIQGATVAIAGGSLGPVAALGSKSISTGNLGAPVLSTVIQGSTKVTVG